MEDERSSWWVWSADAVAFMEFKVDGWENIVLRCSIGSYSTCRETISMIMQEKECSSLRNEDSLASREDGTVTAPFMLLTRV